MQMDLAEFIDFTERAAAEHSDQMFISQFMLREQLFGQYLQKYDTFDTQLLRDYADQLYGYAKGEMMLEDMVAEMERRRKVYVGE